VPIDQLRSVRAARSASGTLLSMGAPSTGVVDVSVEVLVGWGMVDASIIGATYFESGSDVVDVPGELLVSLVDCA
jgi:hypothetical protein